MMTSHLFKILTVLAATILFAGCKLDLVVPTGGDVWADPPWDGDGLNPRNCPGGSRCEFIITDYSFNETFTAIPRPGYVFSKWSAGDGFLCGNSTNPVCTIDNTGLVPGNAAIDAIVAGGAIFYAMPVFTYVGGVAGDTDKDGVLDTSDNCPNDQGGSVWGCPIHFHDRDGDGVANSGDWTMNSEPDCIYAPQIGGISLCRPYTAYSGTTQNDYLSCFGLPDRIDLCPIDPALIRP